MTTVKEVVTKLNDVTDKLKKETDPGKHEALRQEWWKIAVGAFNEHVAGTVRLIDGTEIYTPPIEM